MEYPGLSNEGVARNMTVDTVASWVQAGRLNLATRTSEYIQDRLYTVLGDNLVSAEYLVDRRSMNQSIQGLPGE